jgi:hypothetical protein
LLLPVLHSLKSMKIHGVPSVPPIPSPPPPQHSFIPPCADFLPSSLFLLYICKLHPPPMPRAWCAHNLRSYELISKTELKCTEEMEMPCVGLHLCFMFPCIPRSSLRLINRIGVVFAACCPSVDTILILTWACTRHAGGS